jgi:hypothetical protein
MKRMIYMTKCEEEMKGKRYKDKTTRGTECIYNGWVSG